MKAILKYSAALLAIVAASSCNKIEDNKSTNSGLVHFSVTAGTPATKVYLEDMGEGAYQPCWNADDKLAVFFTLPNVESSTDRNQVDAEFAATLSNDGMTATFEGDVDGDLLVDLMDDEGNLEMYSFLPKSALVKAYAEGRLGLDVPNQQSPVYVNDNYSFDPKADILIAKPHVVNVVDDHASSEESMFFQRITSTLKINILDPDESAMYGEPIESVTITTGKAHIAGRLTVDLKTSEVVSVGQRGGSTSIIATPAEDMIYVGFEGGNSVFISTAAVVISENEALTFIVKTENHTFTKTVSEHPAMKLEAGKISTINLNIVASDVKSNFTPLTTMDEIFAKAGQVGSTATDVYITFNNWIVSALKGTSNAYVTDGTKGFIIYTSNHGFEAGDILNGTIACKVQLYNGAAEITNVSNTTSGLTVTKGGSLTPYETTINNLSGVNTGALISLSKLTYNGSVFTDGSNKITPYDTFKVNYSLTSGRKYDVEGIYIQYNSTKEISPLTAEAFKLLAEETYTVTISETENGTVGSDVTSAIAGQTVTLTITPADGYKLSKLSVTDESDNEIEVNNSKFAMPASNVNVDATFELIPPVSGTPTDVTYNFSEIEGFDDWGTSYARHVVSYDEAEITFASANKNTSTITDIPVTKGNDVIVVMKDSQTINSLTFKCKQWTTKTQTITLNTSTDGGKTFTATSVKSSNFTLTASELSGVNAVKFTFSSSSNQVGIESLEMNYNKL